MKIAKLLFFITCICSTSCSAQDQVPRDVGGSCEGCEALYEYTGQYLMNTDTLPGYSQNTPQLKLTGIVYQQDGKTPASDVILYIYHTNKAGKYPELPQAQGWGRRHGSIRGWVKTGKDGRYTFYTFRPGAYPGRTVPQHIHLTVKEPDTIPYYLDDYTFSDDPLLTQNHQKRLKNRGGSGIITPKERSGSLLVERDIVLGLNVPDY